MLFIGNEYANKGGSNGELKGKDYCRICYEIAHRKISVRKMVLKISLCLHNSIITSISTFYFHGRFQFSIPLIPLPHYFYSVHVSSSKLAYTVQILFQHMHIFSK